MPKPLNHQQQQGQVAPIPSSAASAALGVGGHMAPGVVGGTGAGSTVTDQQDERRQRRLARNRESARQSRRRKKQYLELLEEKVTQLSEEIEGLRLIHLENSERALRQLR